MPSALKSVACASAPAIDRDRRRAEQAVGLDVPSDLGEHRVPRRGERRNVGDGGAGHERARGGRRQSEKLDRPAKRDLLERRAARRRDQKPPCCSHAVDSQFAASAAGNAELFTKPKNRGPAIAIVAGRPNAIELLDDLLGGHRALLKRDVEAVEPGECVPAGRDATLADVVEIALRALGDIGEHVPERATDGRMVCLVLGLLANQLTRASRRGAVNRSTAPRRYCRRRGARRRAARARG